MRRRTDSEQTLPIDHDVTAPISSRSVLRFRLAQWRSLWQRTWLSLKTRGVAGTWARLQQRLRLTLTLRRRTRPRVNLSAVDPSCLFFTRHPQPTASIIIPAFNQLAFTLRCLQSVQDAGDTTPFEIIVVDDASEDETANVIAAIAGVRLQRQPSNSGFIASCNTGAALARGEHLVFLNNDTQVLPGWLDALLSTFIEHPDTGLVGAKLIYADGRLQEAGGLVFSDGSAWNIGRFENPEHPQFNFVREVDYCSGAALAIPRALFESLHGFDNHYAPAYYEDTDLAMRVRAHGLKVRYQPFSQVLHFEGTTAGTDTSIGMKAFQRINQEKFLARWRETLAAEHVHPKHALDATSATGYRRSRQVLFIDSHTPKPDHDSGSARLMGLLQLLNEQGCSTCFLSTTNTHLGTYTELLQRLGVETWWSPWRGSLPNWLAKHGRRFDLIIVSRHYVLAPVLPLLRAHAPQAKIVFDTVDLHFLREERAAALTENKSSVSAARVTRKSELQLMRACDHTWVVSEHEKRLLSNLIPEARVDVVSNIHDCTQRTPGFDERHGLLFVGSYRHPPNVDAALWLGNVIFPIARANCPDLTLHVVGGDAPESVQALGQQPGIVFHGHVKSLDVLLDKVRLSVAPLRYGAGIKGKVNQSLARGLPVVATSCAVEGMFLSDGVDALISDNPEALAAAIVQLHGDGNLWQTLRDGGLKNTQQYFSRDAARAVIVPLLASLHQH